MFKIENYKNFVIIFFLLSEPGFEPALIYMLLHTAVSRFMYRHDSRDCLLKQSTLQVNRLRT